MTAPMPWWFDLIAIGVQFGIGVLLGRWISR